MVVRNGTPDPDTLFGTGDSDTLRGNAGNDQLYGYDGSDSLSGGSGDDQLWADWGDDTLLGGDGNDSIYADAGINLAYGGNGDDTFLLNDINYGGLTTAYGGAGADMFLLFETSGATVTGGGGIDTLALSCFASTALYVDFAAGTVTKDGAFGGGLVYSGVEQLQVLTQDGADTILASSMDDFLNVGRGANQIFAKAGNDHVQYTPNTANTLNGGLGEDTLSVHAANSAIYFIVDTSDGSVDDGQLSLISGFEVYNAYGDLWNDIVAFDSGNDRFDGGAGNDTAVGRAGDDFLRGQSGNDSLIGDEGDDTIEGGTWADSIDAGLGDDLIRGGTGDDLIDAGAGADRIVIQLGHDTITGGGDADAFLFIHNETDFTLITDFTTGSDRLVFEGAFLQNAPADGPLDPALLSQDTATGTPAQFVLRYDALTDVTALLWDPNGADPAGGTYSLATFSGQAAIAATDIFII